MSKPIKGETGRKETRSFGLSPWIIQKIEASVSSGDYTGNSDVANVALTEHFLLEEQRARDEKMFNIYRLILENTPCEVILKDIRINNSSRIEALKKKGVLCVELGDLEGVRACFREVSELEEQISKNKSIKAMYGIEDNETIIDHMIPGKCPRCGEINAPGVNFCYKCGLPLTSDAREEFDNAKSTAEGLLIQWIRENPVKMKQVGELINNKKG